MTPRDYAKVLGWYSDAAGDWYDADHRVVVRLVAVRVAWVLAAKPQGPWPTSDDALVHALRWRDVVRGQG